MSTRLYSFSLSHPAAAARLALGHKGIDYELVELLPGLHPVALRALGFKGATVPAMRVDGERVQGSIEINRYLESHHPSPSLYPGDPAQRERIEAAERWGEEVLQSVPRRIFRWSANANKDVLAWVAEVSGLPFPGLAAYVNRPVAFAMARQAGAESGRVRADLNVLPALLDEVEALLEGGVIGGAEPNAADFQIATSVRSLASFEDLRPSIVDRPAGRHALEIVPTMPEMVPASLPREWIPPR